jgi:hypothetical protein
MGAIYAFRACTASSSHGSDPSAQARDLDFDPNLQRRSPHLPGARGYLARPICVLKDARFRYSTGDAGRLGRLDPAPHPGRDPEVLVNDRCLGDEAPTRPLGSKLNQLDRFRREADIAGRRRVRRSWVGSGHSWRSRSSFRQRWPCERSRWSVGQSRAPRFRALHS